MDNKELKYKKGIEEFIFVAKSSTDIICDVVSNDLPFNEYNNCLLYTSPSPRD